MSFGVITAISAICAVLLAAIGAIVLIEDNKQRKHFDRDLEEWRDEHRD